MKIFNIEAIKKLAHTHTAHFLSINQQQQNNFNQKSTNIKINENQQNFGELFMFASALDCNIAVVYQFFLKGIFLVIKY